MFGHISGGQWGGGISYLSSNGIGPGVGLSFWRGQHGQWPPIWWDCLWVWKLPPFGSHGSANWLISKEGVWEKWVWRLQRCTQTSIISCTTLFTFLAYGFVAFPQLLPHLAPSICMLLSAKLCYFLLAIDVFENPNSVRFTFIGGKSQQKESLSSRTICESVMPHNWILQLGDGFGRLG